MRVELFTIRNELITLSLVYVVFVTIINCLSHHSLNRLEYSTDKLSSIILNTESSLSRVIDTDYVKEDVELARAGMIQQAATAILV